MWLEKIEKKFDLFGIQTHPIPLNPHELRANRTSPQVGRVLQLSDFAPASNGGNSDTNILGLRVYGEPGLFLVFRSAESNR
jgi:hypothetical protein